MDFLREPLQISLAKRLPGRYLSFAADVFAPRPEFEDIEKYKDWAAGLQAKIQGRMGDKKEKKVAWMCVIIDGQGAQFLLAMRAAVKLNDAKQLLDTLLKDLPDELLRPIMESLRAFDELDYERAKSYDLAITMREKVVQHHRLCVECGVESDDEEPPTTLAIWEPLRGKLHDDWMLMAKLRATVILLECGPQAPLEYYRCPRETRRAQLLAERLDEMPAEAPLVHAVRVALVMASEGSLPNLGLHGRTAEFMQRCSEAVKIAFPAAESNREKLGYWDKVKLRTILGEPPRPVKCMSPQCVNDKKTEWIENILCRGRAPPMCKKCNCYQGCDLTVLEGKSWIERMGGRDAVEMERLSYRQSLSMAIDAFDFD